MAFKVSKRSKIAPFKALDLLRLSREALAEGRDVISLAPGQPSEGAPRPILENAARAVLAADMGYTEAAGDRALRQRIARHYQEYYGVEIDWHRIVVTTGSSGGFLLAFLAAFEPGDRVAMAAPGYPAYRNLLSTLGIEPVELLTDVSTRFQPTVEMLENLEQPIDGLIVASPSNPAGTMLHADELQAVALWCDKNGVRLVSDEVYHGIVYGAPAQTAVKFSDTAIVANSFSKYFAMTGWRLGWLVVPEDFVRPVECLAQSLTVSPPTLPQLMALEVFDARKALDAYVERYAQNRKILLAALPEIGFTKLAPAEGAFYIYADISDLSENSENFCQQMLEETGVIMTPGTDFDLARGHKFVRITYAGCTKEIRRAVEKLKNWPALKKAA